jgi:Family of unknown function (DUF6314)
MAGRAARGKPVHACPGRRARTSFRRMTTNARSRGHVGLTPGPPTDRNRAAPLSVLFNRIARCQHVRFTARSVCDPRTVRGAGDVVVRTMPAGGVRIEEAGWWQDDLGNRARFTNISQWIPDALATRVRVEHLRHGVDNAVRLVDLGPIDDTTFRSETPHICGEDRYHASLVIWDDGLRLRWRIEGPHKAMILQTIYLEVPADAGRSTR